MVIGEHWTKQGLCGCTGHIPRKPGLPARPWGHDSCYVRLPEKLWVSRRASRAHVYAWLAAEGAGKIEGWIVLGKLCERQSLGICTPICLLAQTEPIFSCGWPVLMGIPTYHSGVGRTQALAGWDCNTHVISLSCLDVWYLSLSQLKWLFSIYFKDQDF